MLDNTHVRTAVNSGDKHVAMVNFNPSRHDELKIDIEEHKANVRIIESAPDMFEALLAWVVHIDICSGVDEDNDEGWLEMMASRTKAMDLTNKVMKKVLDK